MKKKTTKKKGAKKRAKRSTKKPPKSAPVLALVAKPPKMLGKPEVSCEANRPEDNDLDVPPEVEEWITKLRGDHLTVTADVRISMAADALRRAYEFPSQYLPMMLLADRHLKGAVDADRAAIKRWIDDLKKRRDKGDKLVGRLGKLGQPRLVEH